MGHIKFRKQPKYYSDGSKDQGDERGVCGFMAPGWRIHIIRRDWGSVAWHCGFLVSTVCDKDEMSSQVPLMKLNTTCDERRSSGHAVRTLYIFSPDILQQHSPLEAWL